MTVQRAAIRDEAALRQLFDGISNWGRWGSGDAIGTLNLIDLAKRKEGLASARSGEVISCARPIVPAALPGGGARLEPIMSSSEAPTEGFGQVRDRFIVEPHGPLVTHLDAFSHVLLDGRSYNGMSDSAVINGAKVQDIADIAGGIVTRGILFDVPSLRGVDYVGIGEPIEPAELDELELRAGGPVTAGDALLIHVGRDRRRAAEGAASEKIDGRTALAGMHPDCLPWLRSRDIAILVSDAGHDALPSPHGLTSPIHIGALVFLGLPLVDNADLGGLSTAAAGRPPGGFLFVLAALPIRAGSGSAVNPVVVL